VLPETSSPRAVAAGRSHRVRRAAVAALGISVILSMIGSAEAAAAGSSPQHPSVGAPAATAPRAGRSRWIVQSTQLSTAVDAVRSCGGTVIDVLPQLGQLIVDLTPGQATTLGQRAGVSINADDPVAFTDASTTTRQATGVFPAVTGADRLVARADDGRGITVALVDSGIDRLADFGNRLVGGIDLSGEGDPFHDSYGHGTFVAGLIAGDGASSSGAYVGEAPAANLVSVKVSGADGSVDTAKIIEGIDWVIANRSAYGIRVLNLSVGTDASESTRTAPLDAAVERAWESGIVVVVSAGNYGPGNGSISKPGDDPLVITAGALDDNGTVRAADDSVPSWSSVGPTYADGWFKPDIVAPGRSLVSLRAPGSTVDEANPGSRIGSGNFKGSGTSFSAAVTSGAAALIIQADPGASPDEVKGRMLLTAQRGPVGNPFVDGHGALDVFHAASAQGIAFSQSNVARQVPLGSQATSPAGPSTVILSQSWLRSSWNPAAWDGTTWHGFFDDDAGSTGGTWAGSRWSSDLWAGRSWNGRSWNGVTWSGLSWNGRSWNDLDWGGSGGSDLPPGGRGLQGVAWDGRSWNGVTWSGRSWNGVTWSGRSWNGRSWNGRSWNGADWAGSPWVGRSWNGRSWNGGGWT